MKLFEILEEVNKKESVADRVSFLEENDSKELQFLLQASFDNNVKWLIPDGEPPFTPAKQPENTLDDVVMDIVKLVKYGPWTKKPRVKVENFFISMLESLPKEEAMVMILVKDQKLQTRYKKLTKNVVKKYLEETTSIVIG
jgi:hypothetical protein